MVHFINAKTSNHVRIILFTFSYIALIKCDIIIEKVTEPVELAEGPHWDVKSQKLYYVDIVGSKILRFDPLTKNVTSINLNPSSMVGMAIPVKGSKDKIVAGHGNNLVLITWNGQNSDENFGYEILATVDTDHPPNSTRINDAKCDAAGRLFVGTMSLEVDSNGVKENQGALYKFDNDLHVQKVISPVSISNGLIWNSRNDIMYYIDSPTKQIWSYDYRLLDGSLRNKKVIFNLERYQMKGVPDGMTIDSNNNLWVAINGGSSVIQINPRSRSLLRKIRLPATQVSSLVFGGKKLDVLYVTTGRERMSKEDLEKEPDAGSVYAIKGLGVFGRPSNQFNLYSYSFPLLHFYNV